jgi:periplasmic protein TonB
MTLSLSAFQPGSPRLSSVQLAGVVLVHAGLLAVLLSPADAIKPVMPPRPLMVSLIEPEVDTPQPELKPQPAQPVIKPLPVLAVHRQAPASNPQPLPDPMPQPAPVQETLPKPAPVAVDTPHPERASPPPTPPQPADYLNNPKPPYPRLSNRLREEGTVLLRALINPDGSVARLEVLKSSGYERLDTSAFNTVKSSWKFEPARQNGQPVTDWVNFPIEFTLKNRS